MRACTLALGMCIVTMSACGKGSSNSSCNTDDLGDGPSTRLLVTLQDGVSTAALSASDTAQTTDWVAADTVALKFSDPAAARAAEADLRLDPGVKYVEPDYAIHYTLTGTDPLMYKQWAHTVVQSTYAWAYTTGSPSLVVAVVDTGIDYTHADLARNIWTNTKEIPGNGIDDDHNGYVDDVHGWDFVHGTNTPMADDAPTYHGTHVAGTIAAVGGNGIGIKGHAPTVKLMPLKFMNSSGSGFTSDAVRAIDYAIANGAWIISASWGSYSYSLTLDAAMKRAHDRGLLFVAAAGNDGRNIDQFPFYPASYNYNNVVSVAASTSTDTLATWSNYGKNNVDVAAPGQSIYSTKNGNTYQYLSGTSMATPLVSAVLALIWSRDPTAYASTVRQELMATVTRNLYYSGRVASGGRVNAYSAVRGVTLTGAQTDLPPPDPSETAPAGLGEVPPDQGPVTSCKKG
ncbi:MAG TPA: S8 family peptidase [Bdellovibrionota bacterium]|nr:S8 family peptidase [Bdellovibrionota bacterium]